MKISDRLGALKQSITHRHQERRRLRGPADLHYAIADSISMLNAADWLAATAHSSYFLSLDYLRALEPVLPLNMEARYALIYQGEPGALRPIAAVHMQLAEIKLAQARPELSPKVPRAAAAVIGKVRNSLHQHVLVCGNLLTFGQHGIAFAPGADEHLIWHGVVEVLYRVRRADELVGKTHFVMIKDLHAPYTQQAAHLKNLSYRPVETEPNMLLEFDPSWRTYDDYLGAMASKYRGNVRREILKPIEEAGITVERLTDLAAHSTRLFELYKAVHSNAEFRPFTLRPEYFAAMQAAAGDRLRCSVLRRGEELLGFLFTQADGDTAIIWHIGFDRAAAEELPIYLRLLHAGIADALTLGCKRASFGRTALEPKAALGAKAQDFSILLRHRQPVLNLLIKRLLLGIEHDEAPERNPFKKSTAPE
ncbi:hypothetical protein GCM10027046_16860 [Uliginosibacterium flavum]|uniref:GNAT family N-acetyltransferase n=1 Tax=Uliginosibacterium flavum TaxID=1396831 RepID=A0ABV2TQR3_9RHOO